MKIKLLTERQVISGIQKKGEEIEIADAEGQRLIKIKKAVKVKKAEVK